MAAPGRMAWLIASPIRLMRRSMRNTPIGGALTESARQPTSARRMKANSMKGSMRPWIMRAHVLAAAPRARRSPPAASKAAESWPARARFSGVSTDCVASPRHDFAGQQQRLREMLPHLLDVVQRGDDGAPLFVPAFDQDDEVGDGLGVDGAERLVEQDQRARPASRSRANSTRWNCPPDKRADRRDRQSRAGRAWRAPRPPPACARASMPRQTPISRHSPIATQSNTVTGKLRSMSICCGR